MNISSSAAPGSGDVHVRYHLMDPLEDGVLQSALALLSRDERARHDRFRVDRDRQEFAVGHALLRSTLSEFGDVSPLEWRFEIGSHGKPALAPGISKVPLWFNLSHTRGLVACVVTLGRTHGSAPTQIDRSVPTQSDTSGPTHTDVGIDVERVTRTRDWRGIASRYFSAAEVAQIDRVPAAERETRFLELWTLKEAFAKALGVGLSQALDGAVFELADTGVIGRTLPPAVNAAAWQFALYTPASNHRLAVAVSDGSARRWRIDVRASPDAER